MTSDDGVNEPEHLVLSERTEDGVLILRLNDEKTRNALGPELTAELMSELDVFSKDPALRCLVLTGAGTSFCSGANVRRMASRIAAEPDGSGDGQREQGPWDKLDPIYTARESGKFATSMGPEIVRVLHNLEKPTIAAVNGHAYGLGCGISLACDLRIAGESARFAEAFVRNGLIPADGSAWYLPRLIGISNTLWMQFTGEAVSGAEAGRIGLVNKVVPDGELMEVALAMASRLACGPSIAIGLIKQLVHQGLTQDLSEHLPLASRAQALARATADHKEGVQAFLEKREPNFEGK